MKTDQMTPVKPDNGARAMAELHDTPLARADAASIMDVISRAASDPNTDVEKLERLLGMYERITARDAKSAYMASLVEMKPKLPVIDRRGRIEIADKNNRSNIIQSTPYALWEDIDEKITPILNQHGFALTFRSGVALDGKITVTGILSHRNGHSEETTMTLPHDSTGSKNAVQAVGSSTSYGKRYTAMLLLNIRTRGEDDDGIMGGADGTLDDSQMQHVRDLVERSGADIEAFCKYMGVQSLADITTQDYSKAITALNLKERKARAQ